MSHKGWRGRFSVTVTGPLKRREDDRRVPGMAERIYTLRAERGWSIQELSDRSGLPLSSLSRYENDRTVPTPIAIVVLCDTYEVSADWLLGRTQERE